MKKSIIILAALALAGCERPPAESVAKAGNGYQVERLFTYDGCTVYRFEVSGYGRYFTRCEGAASTSTQWSESCGKNCTRPVDVPTGYTRQQ